MRILVTGGAGFIGSAVVRHLVNQPGLSVVNLDKLTYAGNLASLASIANQPNYHFAKADICDPSAVTTLLETHQPDAIMHLAAESHVDRSISDPAAFITTNVVGTYTLLECTYAYWLKLADAAKAAFRFLHVSTDEVFGSLGAEGLFSEKSAYDPRSPYSASKAASDHFVSAWHHTYGLPVLIANCSNNYGPCQFPEKLIPLIILNCLEDKPLPVYGTGQHVRDWLYVEDHARALWAVMQRGRSGETYNIGGNAERTNLSVVEAICDLVDELVPTDTPRRHLIGFVDDRPGHDARYAMDTTKIASELGWSPEETFVTGLRKTVEWYLDNKDWWMEIRNNRYAGERLGLKSARTS